MDVYPNSFVIRETSKHVSYDRYQLPNILACIDGTHNNGYGITPFCLTPFLNPENQFTVHKRARATVEREFGQVKRRFHCTGSILRLSLERVPSVIIVILHNLAKRWGGG